MTTKWRKKTEKEPVFIGAVKNLVSSTEKCISQNNQIDLFEEYFYKEDAEKFVENLSTKTLMLFKYSFFYSLKLLGTPDQSRVPLVKFHGIQKAQPRLLLLMLTSDSNKWLMICPVK